MSLVRPRPADLDLAFGSAESDVAAERARHAAALFHAGNVPMLMLTGGGSRPDDSKAGLMLWVASDPGAPRGDSRRGPLRHDVRERHELGRAAPRARSPRRDQDRPARLLPVAHSSVALIARKGFANHVRLPCCPPPESCTAGTWRACLGCRRRVAGKAGLLLGLIEADALPDPRL